MARRKRNAEEDLGKALGALLVFLIFILFYFVILLISIIDYYNLKNIYVNGKNINRIIDLNRAFGRCNSAIAVSILILSPVLFVSYYIINQINNIAIIFTYILIGVNIFLIVIFVTLTSRVFAAGLLGVVINKKENIIVFPTDGIIRNITFEKIRNSIIPSYVENINISEIRQLTRQSGKTLLISGDFGSRAITFTDKLRRDELLGYLSKYSKFLDFEMAGSDNYA